MSLTAAIEGATALIEFASAVSENGRGQEPAGRNRRRQGVVRSLREIYFTPRGTLNILAILTDGGKPSDEELERTLPDFNDQEWNIRRRLETLEFEELGGAGLSLRVRRLLDQIRYGKIDLRRDIQQALNESLTLGHEIDRRQAKVLLQRVNALNLMIESLEEELL